MPGYPRATPWLLTLRPASQLRCRLVCLPHAGGGTIAYRGWGRLIPLDVEIVAVQLPGRESRLGEAPGEDISVLREAVARALMAKADGVPTVLFGHSFGALLAYEVCLRLQPPSRPCRLIVSACRAPHVPPATAPVAHLPRADFLTEVRGLTGTSEDVFSYPELVDILLPALRADYRLAEDYLAPTPPRRVDVPITVFGGADDPVVSSDLLSGWSECTSQFCGIKLFRGGHFFTVSQEATVLAVIRDELERVVGRANR